MNLNLYRLRLRSRAPRELEISIWLSEGFCGVKAAAAAARKQPAAAGKDLLASLFAPVGD
jgi:hypothetical protein